MRALVVFACGVLVLVGGCKTDVNQFTGAGTGFIRVRIQAINPGVALRAYQSTLDSTGLFPLKVGDTLTILGNTNQMPGSPVKIMEGAWAHSTSVPGGKSYGYYIVTSEDTTPTKSALFTGDVLETTCTPLATATFIGESSPPSPSYPAALVLFRTTSEGDIRWGTSSSPISVPVGTEVYLTVNPSWLSRTKISLQPGATLYRRLATGSTFQIGTIQSPLDLLYGE